MRNKLKFALVVCTVTVVFIIALVIAIFAWGATIVLLQKWISVHLIVVILGLLAYIAIMIPVACGLPELANKLIKKLGL